MPQRWTQGGPLCPQEVLKRLGRTSELVAQRRERGFLQNARGPDSHKELPSRQVAVWLEPTPRVWKGAVLVIASASQSRQKYIKGSKAACIDNHKATQHIFKAGQHIFKSKQHDIRPNSVFFKSRQHILNPHSMK